MKARHDMRPLPLSLTLALAFALLRSGEVLAQTPTADEQPPPAAPRVELGALIGTSRAPYPTRAFPEVSGYLALPRLTAGVPIGRALGLGARLPLVLARVEQPAGSLYAEAAWGNPELSVSYSRPLLRRAGWTLAAQAQLALGLPIAEHSSRSSQLEGRALALADAVEGYSEPELYTPGMLPITPKARWTLRSRRWELSATLKLPLLLRVSEADLPPETPTHPLAFVPVLELGARLWLTPHFGISTAPRLTVRARSAAGVDDRDGDIQLLIPAALWVRIGEHVDLAAHFQAPLAGPLGGTTFAGGVSAAATF